MGRGLRCRGVMGGYTKVVVGRRRSPEHELSVPIHGRVCRDVQVLNHGIGFPTANELNDVVFNACYEKRGRSSGVEGAGVDLIWRDANVVIKEAQIRA